MKFTAVISFFLLTSLGVFSQQPATSMQEPATRMVRLYPNPAVSYITFELRDNFKRGLTLQLYSGILGKKVLSIALSQERSLLNLNEFPRGIYIYHLVDTNGKVLESGKFQVTK